MDRVLKSLLGLVVAVCIGIAISAIMVEIGMINYAGMVSMLFGGAAFALFNILFREERSDNRNMHKVRQRIEKRHKKTIRKQEYKKPELLCEVCGEVITSSTVFCPYCGNEKKF